MRKKTIVIIGILALAVTLVLGGVYLVQSSNPKTPKSPSPEGNAGKKDYSDLGLDSVTVKNILARIEFLKGELFRTPENYTMQMELGNLYKLLAEYDLAKAEYENAIAAWPDEPTAYNNLADLYVFHFKDAQKALANYLLAIEKDPTYLDVYRSVADLYRSAMPDKVSEIEALMLKGAQNNPDKKASFYEYLQNFYWQEKKYEKALRYNQMLIGLDPKNQKYSGDRQTILADQKKFGNVQ